MSASPSYGTIDRSFAMELATTPTEVVFFGVVRYATRRSFIEM